MKSLKSRVIPLAIGLALVAGLVPSAMARNTSSRAANLTVQNHSVTTVVDIEYVARKTKFTGDIDWVENQVSPDEDQCTERREVNLFKITRRGANKIDSGTFNYFYNFVLGRAASGSYQVRVTPRTFSDRYGDLIECSGARASIKV